jgi:predicted peptidase
LTKDKSRCVPLPFAPIPILAVDSPTGIVYKRSMNVIACILIALTAALAPLSSDDRVDGFIARVYTSSGGNSMPYRLFIPPRYDPHQKYPLILWLHGAGGIGHDNLRQISEDQIPGTRTWTSEKNLKLHPVFIVAPQSSKGWSDATQTQMVLSLLQALKTEFTIDERRVYVAGQSNGGIGVWALLIEEPRLFAAAILVCSAGTFPDKAAGIAQIPVWAFHGDSDTAASVNGIRAMIAALRQAGGAPRYTEYQKAGHDIWERVFKEPTLVDWLFAQHR